MRIGEKLFTMMLVIGEKKNESIFASFRQNRKISDTNKEKKKQQIYHT